MIENFLKIENWSLKICLALAIVFLLALPSAASAANRYWVGAAVGCDGTWADTDCWAATSNGAGAAGVPTSADDVFFDGVGNGASNSTLGASITINSLDFTGYANTFTHGAFTITIDNAGAFNLSAGMTYTLGNTNLSIIQFTNSGTVLITSNGKTGPRLNLTGTGTWQLQDNYTCGGTRIDQTAGTLDINGFTLTSAGLNVTGSTARTLTLGSGTIAITGNGDVLNISGSNLTITANTGSFTHTSGGGGGQTYTFGDFNYNGASFNTTVTSSSMTITAAGTGWNNFSVVPGTSNAVTVSLTAPFTVTGTLTLTGNNSNTRRILVTSNTLGTSRTITSATNALSSVDFRDITGAGAGDWNLSAITGLSGDAGGNSGITFTTPQTQYWVGAAGSWSTAAEWGTSSGGSGGRVPLPQDDVVFDNNSFSGAQTVTLDMPRAGKSIDWSGYNEGQSPTLTTSVGTTLYGSLTLISGMTLGQSSGLTFEGRGSFTLTSAGKSIGSGVVTFAMVGGTITLQDAYFGANKIVHNNGTLDSNNFNVTISNYNFNVVPTATRTLTLGGSTWILTESTVASAWNGSSNTGLTFNAGSSTIIVSNTGANAKTFAGGGLTYNNVIFSGDNITVTGSNTFNQFKVNTSGLPTGLLLTSGTTQTVTAFSTDASLGRVAKLLSSSAGSAATISQASGMVCSEYMSIKDSTATGGASWYAGNSTSVSGNTGWTFSQCPSPNTDPRVGYPTGPANVKIGSSPIAGGAPGWYGTLWGYRRAIVVDHTRVATTSALVNFPVLISVIDPELRSTGNGGKVGSATGDDILFTSSNGTTLLDFEIEKYTPTTGELIAWVEVPSLSGVTDTALYMYFGNASASSAQNPTGVWDANYLAVWHLRDGTTLSGLDSTSNGNNGTVQGSMPAGVGKIDGGASNTTDSSKYISGSGINLSGSEFTVEAWQKPSGAFSSTIFSLGSVGSTRKALHVRAQTNTTTLLGLYSDDLTATVSAQSNVFNYTVATMNSSFVQTLYQNGAYVNSRTAGAMFSGNTDWKIGQQSWDTGSSYGGIIDEVRVSNIVRGSDWIATTYNNHSNPASFYSYTGLENMNGRVNSSGTSQPFLKIRGGVKFR